MSIEHYRERKRREAQEAELVTLGEVSSIVVDAVAELSEVVSTTSESVNDNADAIAELSALVSEIISGGE